MHYGLQLSQRNSMKHGSSMHGSYQFVGCSGVHSITGETTTTFAAFLYTHLSL